MFLQVVTAVVVANAACGAFVVGAIACIKLQKQGVPDDRLPLWVYACLIVAPLVAIPGAYILHHLV